MEARNGLIKFCERMGFSSFPQAKQKQQLEVVLGKLPPRKLPPG